MIEIIKEIILDFHASEINPGTLRHLEMRSISGKATTCIGVRRGGKSTCMLQQVQKLMDSGISIENIFYINFFDDRLHPLQQQGPAIVLEAYYALFPEKKNTETVYCFFDEIQIIPGWEAFADRLLRTEKCEVFITGSSAQMLSKEIATQMRGRSLTWELFPFSFAEYLDHKGITYSNSLTGKKKALLQNAFEKYWETGGFPEVANLDKSLRIKIHQEYFNTILFRDLIERHNISHPKAITDLAYWFIDNTSSLYSINRLTGYLKSLGHKAPKASVSNYIEWLEDAYFFFTVRIFDASLARSNTNPKKIYCIDHSLVTSISSGILINSGHILENLVFNALRRISEKIFYYKTSSDREVDFILRMPDKSLTMFQVCESMVSPETRKRELSALEEGMKEQDLTIGTIVTRNEKEQIETDSGIINIVPIWSFLLQIDNHAKLM